MESMWKSYFQNVIGPYRSYVLFGFGDWSWKIYVVFQLCELCRDDTMEDEVRFVLVCDHNVWSGHVLFFDALCYYPHEDVIKWKHFPRHWLFVREIHRSPVNYPHKGQWRGTLMFSLIFAWTNGWVNNTDTNALRCHRAHYGVTAMGYFHFRIFKIYGY